MYLRFEVVVLFGLGALRRDIFGQENISKSREQNVCTPNGVQVCSVLVQQMQMGLQTLGFSSRRGLFGRALIGSIVRFDPESDIAKW